MTLDEAIAHAKEVASEQKRRSGECVENDNECDKFSSCLKCAEEHEQLVNWLEDLKRTQEEIGTDEWIKEHDRLIRNKAIDDFVKSEDYLMGKIKEEKAEVSMDYEWRKVVCLDDIRRMLHQGLLEIAEQLKAGVANDRQ